MRRFPLLAVAFAAVLAPGMSQAEPAAPPPIGARLLVKKAMEHHERWHPFQVVCQGCGRLGTTEVVAYEGGQVEYFCRPSMVKWAKGCGHHGKMAPFDGNGKLPWKLEWAAKWRSLGVTIEGAGKDHTTKGGARDVSNACLEALFGQAPPLNIPYEFFLARGKKMSSSKGIGTWARDMADFLAPEVLRYLILRTQPQTPVDFPLEAYQARAVLPEEFIVKLFNDFDRLKKRTFSDPKIRDDEKELYRLCETHREEDFFEANFQLVLTFVQMPHVDLIAEMEQRKGAPLTEAERKHLERRAQSARFWLESFARPEERTTLQETLPASAQELKPAQRAFLHLLAEAVKDAEWNHEALQAKVFDTARRTPIAQAPAFQAVYRVFLDKLQGPPAGALMSVLPRDLVLRRLVELPHDDAAFWREVAVSAAQVEATIAKEKDKVASVKATVAGDDRVVVEVTHHDGKTYLHRVSGPGATELAARLGSQTARLPRAAGSPGPCGAGEGAQLRHEPMSARDGRGHGMILATGSPSRVTMTPSGPSASSTAGAWSSSSRAVIVLMRRREPLSGLGIEDAVHAARRRAAFSGRALPGGRGPRSTRRPPRRASARASRGPCRPRCARPARG